MFNFAPKRQVGPAGPRGWRAYAVGDVHGRLDLLDQLLDKIHEDLNRRPAKKVLLVFVGDLIDRGPGSAQVVERLRTYIHPNVQTAFILGNHEEVLLRILAGDAELITKWRWFGGTECLSSYGVDTVKLAKMKVEDALELLVQALEVDLVRAQEPSVAARAGWLPHACSGCSRERRGGERRWQRMLWG